MTSELNAFIEKAIVEQGWPYEVVPTDSGFTLQLDLSKVKELETAGASEAFKVAVSIEDDESKPTIELHEAINKLDHGDDSILSFGEPIALDDAIGSIETEEVTSNDSWKLFIAKRWLVSLLEFKGYKLKEPAKARSRVALFVIIGVVVFAILAAAFSGIANSMANGAIDGYETVDVDTNHKTPDNEVLQDFFG